MKLADLWKNGDSGFRKNLVLFLGAYFLVLFNYPLIRASSTAFFFEAYGAKSSPKVLFAAVFILALVVSLCSHLQKRWKVQRVFLLVSLLSGLVFIVGTVGDFSILSFTWKEIYVVLQVHLLLAYANIYFSRDEFKLLLGPVGAVGSLGGILGGLAASLISTWYNTEFAMALGILTVVLPVAFFSLTQPVRSTEEKRASPLKSLSTPEVRKYVALVAGVVLLTQFVINIADFMFHLRFEETITDARARTAYLGNLYSVTNLLTLALQLLVLPFLLPRVSEKNFHLFIPLTYGASILLSFLGEGLGLLPLASLYVYLKASDYSLFSAGKEILYQPLKPEQKYGAKYLTDMLVYRAGKAVVALVLIYLQTSTILNMLMVMFLGLWIILIIRLFRLHRQIFS